MSNTQKIVLLFGFLLVSASVTFIRVLNARLDRPILLSNEKIFEVTRGSSVNGLAYRLEHEGILPVSNRLFRYYALYSANEGTIKTGEYKLSPSMSSRDLLRLFRSGKVEQRLITFTEGWTFQQWRDAIGEHTDIIITLDKLSEQDIMKLLGGDQDSAEGQFFPDTYHYVKGEKDQIILKRAHLKMQKILNDEWHTRTETALKSPYEALILASIIEKETGYAPDRGLIARVFLNRLAQGIRLQSDPTTIYGLGDQFQGDLRREHLSDTNPYNTYAHKGLPPTPISTPGLASIHAALHPAVGDYLYFVGKGDGSSQFSVTLAEHNAAVRRYQKHKRVKNYRSSPQ